MPAPAYHASPGVSKSILDVIHDAPGLLEWSRSAPVDDEAETAVNIGSALHACLLEPEVFAAEYVEEFSPPKGALVTTDDLKGALDRASIPYVKSASKAVLAKTLLDVLPDAPISDALYDQWERGINGRTVLSTGEARKIRLMRDSVLAHPMARKLLEADGHTERCHFWHDAETGELCRSRIDKEAPRFGAIVDVKTTGVINRFSDSVREYRYHVQDVFYSTGYTETTGEAPRAFVFLVVSTTRDRGRYPVRLFSLTAQDRDVARAEIRADMEIYAKCRRTGIWPGIETISLPGWYLAKAGV